MPIHWVGLSSLNFSPCKYTLFISIVWVFSIFRRAGQGHLGHDLSHPTIEYSHRYSHDAKQSTSLVCSLILHCISNCILTIFFFIIILCKVSNSTNKEAWMWFWVLHPRGSLPFALKWFLNTGPIAHTKLLQIRMDQRHITQTWAWGYKNITLADKKVSLLVFQPHVWFGVEGLQLQERPRL